MSSLREQGVLVVADGLNYEDVPVTTSAVGLTLTERLKKDIRRTVIQPLGGIVRWRSDGVDPTATSGMRLNDEDILVYDGDPSKIKFVKDSTSPSNPTLAVHYFGVT